jgi:membrane protease YdiL (CAAX protease family)
MARLVHATAALAGYALTAIVATALTSGAWTALLLANLATTPSIPWSAPVMLLLLSLLWRLLGGWRPRANSIGNPGERLRAGPVPTSIAAWAVFAGLLWLAALSNFWIVLHRLVTTPASHRPDYSRLGLFMVLATLVTASISGAISEEAGFRGYFQGALERRGLGPAAILIVALVMAPVHSLTQGFAWPTLLFYLLVDAMLGSLAFITKSIRPGIAVHTIGLFVFFAFIWPHDAGRRTIWRHGTDNAFWLSVALIAIFGAAGSAALVRLASLVRRSAGVASPGIAIA